MEDNGLNLVLLGKTGSGKSATGNTILGRQAFESKKSPKSVTQDVAAESGTVCGCRVTVYDTPGIFDPELSEEECQQKYQSILQKCESGPCVFLLVMKADRYTKEERETVEKIEKLLGQNRMKKTWILFTRGDELEDGNMTIKEFINETEPLKKLIQKYDRRYHVFNNKKKKHIEQVKMLLAKIFKTLHCLSAMVKGAEMLKQNPLKRKITKNAESDSTVSSLSSRRIVLLGKSGAGKSAAGNTILGQKEFRSEMTTISVTTKCSVKHSTVSGRSVSVVDTPGFFDTKMNAEELMTEIAQSVYISSPGPHAFLIVFPVNNRFTEQEQQIPQITEMLFGEEVLKYSIILFTHGDQLKRKSIETLIEQNSRLKALVKQCGGRYHVFNNKKKNNREQVNDLLQKIDTMIEQNGGGHYSNQMFEDAQRYRQEEEEQRQREEEQRKLQEEKQRQEKEMQRQREEKERNEKEIERVRKETEDRIRAELEGQQKSELERLKAEKQREEQKREQEEKQRLEEIARVRKEREETRAELEAHRSELENLKAERQREEEEIKLQKEDEIGMKEMEKPRSKTEAQQIPEQERDVNIPEVKTSSGFMQFFFEYRAVFYAAAVVLGIVIGGVVAGVTAGVGGVLVGGIIAGGAVGGTLVGIIDVFGR